MAEDRSSWASANPKRLERLVNEFRRRESAGPSEDELAVWLKFQTASFGDSGKVLSVARGISTLEAYGALRATSVWENATTRFRLMTAVGSAGVFSSPNGRTFAAGDLLQLPRGRELAHPGPGNAWRVMTVGRADDPEFAAQLTIEPAT